ncbi:MAG: hypothetical protein HYX62_02835 [Gammaproteobacteria bacterium]|nr:hypothetical protein [Gammaproteobacteria bacterium]
MRFFGLGFLLLILSGAANAYIWSAAVPTEVHVVPEGLVLLGNFNNIGVTCATGPKAILLPSTDPNFNRKLSMALTAITTGKQIQVLINDPIETNCIQISAMGYVPVAFYYYWQLK